MFSSPRPLPLTTWASQHCLLSGAQEKLEENDNCSFIHFGQNVHWASATLQAVYYEEGTSINKADGI